MSSPTSDNKKVATSRGLYLQGLVAYFFLATAFLLAKEVTEVADPVFAIAVRMLAAGIFLSLGAFLVQGKGYSRVVDALPQLLKAAFFGEFLCFFFEFIALKKLDVSTVTVAFGATPVAAAIWEWLLRGRKFTRRELVGIFLTFAGSAKIPALLLGGLSKNLVLDVVRYPLETLLLWISVFAGAYVWFPMHRAVEKTGISERVANAIVLLLTGVFSSAILALRYFATAAEFDFSTWVRPGKTLNFAFLTLALVLSSSWIFNEIYLRVAPKIGFTAMALLGVSSTVFSKLFELLLYNESVTAGEVFSFATFGAGLAIFLNGSLRRKG